MWAPAMRIFLVYDNWLNSVVETYCRRSVAIGLALFTRTFVFLSGILGCDLTTTSVRGEARCQIIQKYCAF